MNGTSIKMLVELLVIGSRIKWGYRIWWGTIQNCVKYAIAHRQISFGSPSRVTNNEAVPHKRHCSLVSTERRALKNFDCDFFDSEKRRRRRIIVKEQAKGDIRARRITLSSKISVLLF